MFFFLCYQLFTVGNSNPGSAFPYICLNLHTQPAHTHTLTLTARAHTHARPVAVSPSFSSDSCCQPRRALLPSPCAPFSYPPPHLHCELHSVPHSQ